MGEVLRFCMCCGEDVPTVLVERAGRPELNCVHCGFTLDIPGAQPEAPRAVPETPRPVPKASRATLEARRVVPETSRAATKAPRTAPEAPRTVPCIITVDDADFHRSVLRGLLLRSGLAQEVVALTGGAEMVTAVANRFAEGQPVNLVILDVEMPGMDGFTAARFLRSLEVKMRRQPCPLIFFTSRKADENLRRQLALMRPAWYCAKNADADHAEFLRRVATLIGHVTALLAAPPPRPTGG